MINIVPFLSTPTHAFACRPSRRRAAWLRAGTRRPLCNGGPCRTMWVEEQQARSEMTTPGHSVSGKGLGRMKLSVRSQESEGRSSSKDVSSKDSYSYSISWTSKTWNVDWQSLISSKNASYHFAVSDVVKNPRNPLIPLKSALQELWCSTLAVRITPPPLNLEETSKGAETFASVGWQVSTTTAAEESPPKQKNTTLAQGTRQVNWWGIFRIQVDYGGLWWIHLYSRRHAS